MQAKATINTTTILAARPLVLLLLIVLPVRIPEP